MPTSSDLLTAVEAAISARLNGGAVESYGIEGYNLRYASLEQLMKLRDKFRLEVDRASGTQATNFASFKRPS